MKEISERLGAESWNLIDATLHAFGVSTADSWSGGTTSYVLSMVQSATDEQLVELSKHVGYEFESTAATHKLEPPFWRKGMLRVFISHLSAQKVYAAQLQQELFKYGISGFVAHNDVEPTTEWQTEIETALATCDALVALLHDHFHESKWTDQEIGFAMGRSVPVFAVKFGEAPYGFIGRFQAFNGTGKSAVEVAEELFETYRKNKQTQHQMASVLVYIFEHSPSFADAKRVIGYLEELQNWHPSFSARVEHAVETNSQVGHSFGVPERVKKLVARWAKAATSGA
jgi:hypothetical protein